MKKDVVMPKLGESIMEGTILKWWKQIGDMVEKDETIVEISTDKVDSEIPSPFSGKLVEILYQENDTVEVGTVIAYLESEGGAGESSAPAVEETKKEEPPIKKVANMSTTVIERMPTRAMPAIKPAKGGERSTFYSPLVLNIAGQEGIGMDELATIAGTGKGGRVTKKDILAYVQYRSELPTRSMPKISAPAMPVTTGNMEVEVIPMDNVRKKIAHHMRFSLDTSAHVYSVAECDVTGVLNLVKKRRPDFMKTEGMKLTFNPFILYAVSKAVKDFPTVNSSVDGETIIRKKKVNFGRAVATDHGLFVPVIKNADDLNFRGLARASYNLAIRARDKKLTMDDIQGSTISVTNPGVFGNIFGLPIINQPNVAILGVGAIKKRPVVIESEEFGDTIGIRQALQGVVGRIDGDIGGLFLQKVVDILENITEDVL